MIRRLLLLVLLGYWVHAQAAQDRDISLMTVSPGTEFWSVYGHTALVIDGHVYGFGVFSFEQSGFIQAFLQNKMRYEMGVTDLDFEAHWAEKEQRDLVLRPLHIEGKHQEALVAYLRWHWQPENRAYEYDYFFNNCATKIRDLLNQVTDGALKASSEAIGSSFFEQTFPVKNQSWMNLGLALGYGQSAYQTRSLWELMAFPEVLQKAVANEAMKPWVGTPVSVVSASQLQTPYHWFKTHAALLLWSLVWVVFLAWTRTRRWAAKIWSICSAFLAMVLLFLWMGTEHQVAAWNPQLLLFLPWFLISWRWGWWLVMSSTLLWVPISLLLGSDYVWPMALINLWVLHVLKTGDLHKR